jgi:hypothetical protein
MGRNKQNILSASVRATLQGGERYTPYDEVASVATHSVVYDESRDYELQFSPQFFLSFTISYKINKEKLSHEFSMKMMNATQSEEYWGDMYNFRTNSPEMKKGTIAIPSIGYKLEF